MRLMLGTRLDMQLYSAKSAQGYRNQHPRLNLPMFDATATDAGSSTEQLPNSSFSVLAIHLAALDCLKRVATGEVQRRFRSTAKQQQPPLRPTFTNLQSQRPRTDQCLEV